ncbi:hypothetical protein FDP41_009204 [Naegleria fowleri]|uniref:Aminotransferase class I/classII large domain-containing protein n=1 Tax=Naegleria fowleri TaxID=5763 RepID=A0A6A5BC52_NAEFO|nr:uncharacterized protein FDP41_009204 [Naegleria fowleri]KAF0972301.1 hypothetical protein FDP41_009204 [Naegleria fowleri]CAG4709761.1 unnamed protein product [Naegleria fowleri]
MSQTPEPSLPKGATMRDIFDYCEKHGLDSVAQGMIELAPPMTLRSLLQKITMDDSVHQYRARMGQPVYREGLLNMLRNHYGMKNLELDNILAVQGVTAGCLSTLLWMKEQGKTQIGLMTPFYTYHLRDVESVFGNTKEAHEKHARFLKLGPAPSFDIDFVDIEENYLKKGLLDCIMICNPGNPTTRVYEKEELEKLAHLCAKYNCYVLLDECYCDMVWRKDESTGKLTIDHVYCPLANDEILNTLKNVIVCRGFSKNMGCQSWRCGYVIAQKDVINALMRTHDPLYICVPYFQHALGEYLSQDLQDFERHVKETGQLMLDNWQILRDAFCKSLGWKAIEPSGSMYGLFEHNSASDLDAVVEALKLGVGVSPANIFFPPGNDNTGMVRIHLGISSEKAKRIAKQLLERSGN